MLADSHCHLDQLKNPEKAMRLALNAGVERVLTDSTSLASIRKTLALAKVPGVMIALGLHPSEVPGMRESEIEEAFSLIENNAAECSAIGEVGLDFKHAETDAGRLLQERVFRRFIGIAKKLSLPVCVHARYAESRCLDILEEESAKKVHMHWFTNSAKTSAKAVSLGYMISCGPIILYDPPSAEVVRKIPLGNLLLETDAPVPFGGKESSPSWIPRVCKKVAELKGIPVQEIEGATGANFSRLFANQHFE